MLYWNMSHGLVSVEDFCLKQAFYVAEIVRPESYPSAVKDGETSSGTFSTGKHSRSSRGKM